ncbi:acetolactate decarboxylase [Gimesia algae]|uniref:Alpha-acetolactate decarboxylase n=1 Tax=Gimesia algae TaxID=2527971 RepID=A0A517VEX4_9PLAN|nr:acetolactate decarboxylase [Gimesia algae]QDT91539.1 Alpha-acetolactate decarboxylase [Gimesia algae]
MSRLALILLFGLFVAMIGSLKSAIAGEAKNSGFVQYGKIHEVIGKQKHQGRVRFTDLTARLHFYGVAALDSLAGEATVFDGKVILTKVKSDGALSSETLSQKTQAALLVGAYVESWTEHSVTKTIKSDDLDSLIEQTAKKIGLNTNEPFMFVIQGDFQNVRFHVINGACPIRARMRKEVLPQGKRPYEADLMKITGKLVGVFAKDSVGNITHPATTTHVHLLYKDDRSGEMRTGHVEQVTLQSGTTLMLPEEIAK